MRQWRRGNRTQGRQGRRWFLRALCLGGLVWMNGSGATQAQAHREQEARSAHERILFLGDSNTYAGTYVQYLEAALFTRQPERAFTIWNLGLPSETVSGLSEPDHPFPRPNVHDRLDRALAQTRPTLVIACYGMNDGIYYPFAEERFARYRAGVERLIAKVEQAGARLILLTPPPFDPTPVREKALPDNAPKFSWERPNANYALVLERYSAWLKREVGTRGTVIDSQGVLSRAQQQARRRRPNFRFADDGIHFNALGHWLIANELLRHFGVREPRRSGLKIVESPSGELTVTWTAVAPLPMPAERIRGAEVGLFAAPRSSLLRRTLPRARYALYEGDQRIKTWAREELNSGVDLALLSELTPNRRAAELWALVQKRERLLCHAGLTQVGHAHPYVPAGVGLAQAQREAAEMETQIRALAVPTVVALRLVPQE